MENKKAYERCPACETSLARELSHHFWTTMPGVYFKYDCDFCGTKLSIEVETVPHFMCWEDKNE